MTTKLYLIVFLGFIGILGLNYCVKNSEAELKINYYDCHEIKTWDEDKVYDKLIGTWYWDLTNCPNSLKTSSEPNQIKLVFYENFKLEIYENEELSLSANWEITGSNNSFKLNTKPFVGRVHGTILFCNDRVEFLNSWLDGCDFYYHKAKD